MRRLRTPSQNLTQGATHERAAPNCVRRGFVGTTRDAQQPPLTEE
jgi:hypothetical protein